MKCISLCTKMYSMNINDMSVKLILLYSCIVAFLNIDILFGRDIKIFRYVTGRFFLSQLCIIEFANCSY